MTFPFFRAPELILLLLYLLPDDNSTPMSPKSPECKNQSAKPPLSPKHEPVKSKREQRQEQESRVYNLATDKLIKNLMTEYKKRKNQNAMPSFMKISKKKKEERKKQKTKMSDPVEQVIEEQQKSSIMKVGAMILIFKVAKTNICKIHPTCTSLRIQRLEANSVAADETPH